MEQMKRTHTCGELRAEHVGTSVILNGWVHRNRDHGGIHFINLRDRYGITQIVIDEDAPAPLSETVGTLKFEYCIAVTGTVRERPDEMKNKDMSTGDIEVAASDIRILSRCETLPFMIDEKSEAREDLRLKYRYLDLRSFSMQRNIALRHTVTWATREFMTGEQFYEIETPTLIRSTPEGARDLLVPSRLQPGRFYALPQSPQMFKQILMVSGFDKYYQIARCYRDEDARGDRQLEFTQIDVEMSFVSRDDVLDTMEGLMCHIFESAMDIELQRPFPRFSYREAMDRYGTDKPDLRFDLELEDISTLAGKSSFRVFSETVASGGAVKALRIPGKADYSRKQIDNLEKTARIYGAKGLAWFKVTDDGIEGGVAKFLQEIREDLMDQLEAKPGDLIVMVAGTWTTACTALGAVRNAAGKDLGLAEDGVFRFCWIIDFPLFEWNEEKKGWNPMHHMFSMPQESYIDTMEEDPGSVMGDLYDLVCNGFELASGSIRIHDPEIQKKVFRIIGFSEEEASERFGFLFNSFRYGPPPHGGIAVGLDRLVMIMAGEPSIREVIPFPKNTAGISPLEDSPSTVDRAQLQELHIALEQRENSTSD